MVYMFILYIAILSIAMVYFIEKEKEKDFEKDLKKEFENESKRFDIFL